MKQLLIYFVVFAVCWAIFAMFVLPYATYDMAVNLMGVASVMISVVVFIVFISDVWTTQQFIVLSIMIAVPAIIGYNLMAQ